MLRKSKRRSAGPRLVNAGRTGHPNKSQKSKKYAEGVTKKLRIKSSRRIRMTEVYKGIPVETLYQAWLSLKTHEEEAHQRKLERDRRARQVYREKNRDRLNQESREYYKKRKVQS